MTDTKEKSDAKDTKTADYNKKTAPKKTKTSTKGKVKRRKAADNFENDPLMKNYGDRVGEIKKASLEKAKAQRNKRNLRKARAAKSAQSGQGEISKRQKEKLTLIKSVAKVLELVGANGHITTQQVEHETGRSERAARLLLDKMQKAKMLRRVSGVNEKKARVYRYFPGSHPVFQ